MKQQFMYIWLTESNLPKHNHGGTTGKTDTNHYHQTGEKSGQTYARIIGAYIGDNKYMKMFHEVQGSGYVEQFGPDPHLTLAGSVNWHTYNVSSAVINLSHIHDTYDVNWMRANRDGNIHDPNHNHTIPAEGGDQAHDNMPPYIVKYCWERTA